MKKMLIMVALSAFISGCTCCGICGGGEKKCCGTCKTEEAKCGCDTTGKCCGTCK